MSNIANIKKVIILDFPRQRRIDHPLVESISREIVLESEWFLHIEYDLNPDNEATGQIIPEISPN